MVYELFSKMAKINIQQLDRYETEYKSYEKINRKKQYQETKLSSKRV